MQPHVQGSATPADLFKRDDSRFP